jgi:hypothetical protein
MAELDAAEIMCSEIKTPMNFNKTAEFGAHRNNHLCFIILYTHYRVLL